MSYRNIQSRPPRLDSTNVQPNKLEDLGFGILERVMVENRDFLIKVSTNRGQTAYLLIDTPSFKYDNSVIEARFNPSKANRSIPSISHKAGVFRDIRPEAIGAVIDTGNTITVIETDLDGINRVDHLFVLEKENSLNNLEPISYPLFSLRETLEQPEQIIDWIDIVTHRLRKSELITNDKNMERLGDAIDQLGPAFDSFRDVQNQAYEKVYLSLKSLNQTNPDKRNPSIVSQLRQRHDLVPNLLRIEQRIGSISEEILDQINEIKTFTQYLRQVSESL